MDEFLLYVAVGFAAQIIDGAIGMAYGISGTTVLLGFGVPPATASACIHAAEIFTTGVSGFSHWRMGNVKVEFLWRLVFPGMVGGVVGAYALANLEGDVVRPYVSIYLLLMGLVILWRAWRRPAPKAHPPRYLPVLGVSGGVLDAIGGGGWGTMVTSSLVGHGTAPRFAVGTANLAEFFVTTVITGTFVLTIGLDLWPIIAGLLLGGVVAAPLAAFAASRLPDRPMMILVGSVVILLSMRTLLQAFT